jgi:hypothetical protein
MLDMNDDMCDLRNQNRDLTNKEFGMCEKLWVKNPVKGIQLWHVMALNSYNYNGIQS